MSSDVTFGVSAAASVAVIDGWNEVALGLRLTYIVRLGHGCLSDSELLVGTIEPCRLILSHCVMT